ncbi:MAG: hypothetical protein QXE80_03530 [Pyrobaculum sp.]
MLAVAQKTASVKIFAEPVILSLSAINIDREVGSEFLANVANVILEELANKFANLKEVEFDEPIQNLQKAAWYERFFNYSVQLRSCKVRSPSLVHVITSGERFYLGATFSVLLPSVQLNDKFSIGLLKEIEANTKVSTREVASEWLNLFFRALRQELKGEVTNLESRLQNFRKYVPGTQMRGSYLRTLLSMYNTHTALSILKENL